MLVVLMVFKGRLMLGIACATFNSYLSLYLLTVKSARTFFSSIFSSSTNQLFYKNPPSRCSKSKAALLLLYF